MWKGVIILKDFFSKFLKLILMSSTLCALLFNIVAFAATKKTIGITFGNMKSSVTLNETFTCEIGFNNFSGVVKGIQAAKFVIQYDSAKFDCTVNPIAGRTNANELTITKSTNKVVIIYLDSSPGETPIVGNGSVIEVKFKVKSNVTSGIYSFNLSSGSTSTYVDCDSSPNQRNVKPMFPSNSEQKIKVHGLKSSLKNISEFSFKDLPVKGKIIGTDIKAIVPHGTNIKNLIADFKVSAGAVVKIGSVTQVSGVTANNFSNTVNYTVIAEDGSKKNYYVKVAVALKTDKDINNFCINGMDGSISETNITVPVYKGTNLTKLVATFSTTGINVKVGNIVQVSGQTSNNFTDPLTYTVTAYDGSTKEYKVYVKLVAVPSSSISSDTMTLSSADNSSGVQTSSVSNPKSPNVIKFLPVIILSSVMVIMAGIVFWIKLRKPFIKSNRIN